MLTEVDNGLRALPATAQVAKQEGEYLASFFNACDADAERLRSEAEEFDYVHKGSLAYIGKNAAVADIPGFAIVKGVAGGSSGNPSRPSRRSPCGISSSSPRT